MTTQHRMPRLALLTFTAVGLATLAGACGPGDCDEPETCASLCSDVGSDAPDPEKTFQVCVQNAGATGGDLVLVDDSGAEVFRCYDEHDELGNTVGTCVDDYAGAKLDYCGC